MFFTTPKLTFDSWYKEPETDLGDESSWLEVANSASESLLKSNSALSEHWNLNQAYDTHNTKVKEITGVDLPNPASVTYGWFENDDEKKRFNTDLAKYREDGGSSADWAYSKQWREQEYRRRLGELADKHPDKKGDLLPDMSFIEQSYDLARKAQNKEQAVWDRSGKGAAAWSASLAGGLWGSAQDPVNWITAPIGFGGVGTGAKGLAMGFLKAGSANAIVEAGVQPFVQSYRDQAGLDSGLEQAATAVGGAFAFGGLLDTGVRGIARGLRYSFDYEPIVVQGVVRGYRKRGMAPAIADGAAPAIPGQAEPPPSVDIPTELLARAENNDRAAIDEIDRIIKAGDEAVITQRTVDKADAGDVAAIREIAEKTGLANDPIARQALDAMDANETLRAKPSERVLDVDHEAAITQGLRHASDPELEPPPVVRENATPQTISDLKDAVDGLEAEVQRLRAEGDDLATREARVRLFEVRQAHDTARQAIYSAEVIERIDGGDIPQELADIVASHVPDKSAQSRMISDLTARKPENAREARQMLSEMLASPDYRPDPVDTSPPPAGLKTRALDDPYGKEAVAQVEALKQKMSDELGIGKEPPTPEEQVAELKAIVERGDDVRKAIEESAGLIPEGVTVKTFSSVSELPDAVAFRVEAANARAFAEGVRRFQYARSNAERDAARSFLDAAKAGRGMEGIADGATIWIATYASHPKGRVAHEVVHALRTMGKIAPDEVKALAEFARTEGLFDKPHQSLYRKELESRGMDADKVLDLLDEEAAAHAVEYRANLGRPLIEPPQVKTVLDRLAEFFASVRDALRLKGFVTEGDAAPRSPANDALEAFMSGEMVKRQGEKAWMRQVMKAEDLTAFAMRNGDDISLEAKIANFEAIRQAIDAAPREERRSLIDGYDVEVWPGVGNVTYYVVERGKKLADKKGNISSVGRFVVKPAQRLNVSGVEVTNASVADKHQRKGIARAVYDMAERDFGTLGGVPPSPRDQLSPDGKAFWEKRMPGVMFAFAGERAKTADLDALALAKRMTLDGIPRDEIWVKTGWGRGVDGKWRFEIDDSQAEFLGGVKRARRLDKVLDHPAMAEAYPGLGASTVRGLRPTEELIGMLASYNTFTREFALRDAPEFDPNTKSSALHESQHYIQGDEGFGQGANEVAARGYINDQAAAAQIAAHEAAIANKPRGLRYFNQKAWDDYYSTLADMMTERLRVRNAASEIPRSRQELLATYKKFAGEVEARTVQKRMDMTADERRARPFWHDYDVPEDQQIVRFADGVQNSEPMFEMRQDQDTGRSMRRELDQLGYFSGALEAAKNLKQAKGTPEQMLAQLKASGAKQAELDATGLLKWIEEKSGSRGSGADAGSGAVIGAPNWDKWGARTGESTKMGRETHLPLLKEDGTKGGSINYHEQDDAVYIEGVIGGRRSGARGQATRAIKAIVDYAAAKGKPVIATKTEGAKVYWDIMGFRRQGINSILDAEQLSKIKTGEINSTIWGHERGYGRMFEDTYGPGASELALPNGDRTSGTSGRADRLKQSSISKSEIIEFLEKNRVVVKERDRGLVSDEEFGRRFDELTEHVREKFGLSGHKLHSFTDSIVWNGTDGRRTNSLLDSIEGMADPQFKALIDSAREGARENRFRQHSLDPENSSYRETVVYLGGEPTDMTSIGLGHTTEPNTLGIIISSLHKRDGRTTYLANQIQSDSGQAVRDGKFKYGEPHQLVRSTDAWVDLLLKRALRQAIDAGADEIAIPSGATVHGYNDGQLAGMQAFYDGIVPKNLRNIIAKLDKESPSPTRIDQLETPTKGMAGKGFTLFPLTPEVKARVKLEGQPLFAMRNDKPDLSQETAKPSEGQFKSLLDQVRASLAGIELARLTAGDGSARFVRDASGLVQQVVRAGKKMQIARDDDGRVTGLSPVSDEIQAAISQATETLAPLIEAAQRAGVSDFAKALPQYATALRKASPEDLARMASELMQVADVDAIAKALDDAAAASQSDMMFAFRRDDGTQKPSGKTRAQMLQEDLAAIEAQFATATGDERAKLHAQRAALLGAEKLEERLDDLERYQDHWNRRDTPKAAMFTVENSGQAPFHDLSSWRDEIMGRVERMIAGPIWDWRKGAVTGDLRRTLNSGVKLNTQNFIREAAGEGTKDPLAKEFAKTWLAATEYLRQRFNAAGGDIAKLNGWFMHQWHDADALIKSGREPWVEFIMPLLDRKKIIDHKTNAPMTDADLTKMLKEIWRTITSDGYNSLEVGDNMGKGALYKRHMEHRVLHFKDADAWLKYNETFGGGDVYAAMIGHISSMSRDIALMERFGPNPELTWQRLKQFVVQEAKLAGPAKSLFDEFSDKIDELRAERRALPSRIDELREKLNTTLSTIDRLKDEGKKSIRKENRNRGKITELTKDLPAQVKAIEDLLRSGDDLTPKQMELTERIADLMAEMSEAGAYSVTSRNPVERAERLLQRADEMWKSFVGTTNAPISSTLAGAMVATRNWISATTLIFAPFSAIADQATQLAARAFVGMPATRQLASFVSGFTKGSRQWALAQGFALDQAQAAFASQNRFTGWVSTRHISGYIADRSHAFSMLSPMTQAVKIGWYMDFTRWMGTLKDRPLVELPEDAQAMLGRHDISPADWDAIRTAGLEDVKGLPGLTPLSIEKAVGEDLASKYVRMIIRERKQSVVEPTLRGKTAFISETRPGTPAGELLRSAAMLKSFPTTYMLLIMGRLYHEIMAGRGLKASTMSYGAAVFIVGTLMGAMAKQLKAIGQGRDPEDMTQAKFWAAAFMQSGGVGIFGDFIGSSINRFGGGLAQTIAGPVADRATTLLDLTAGNLAQYAMDEKTNAGRELTKFMRQNTPGMLAPWYVRTAYERLIVDKLQELVDPDVHRSHRQRVLNNKKVRPGNEFYWPPGSASSPRAPDFGAALGSR